MIQTTSLPIVYPEIFLLLLTSLVALVGVNASDKRLGLTYWIAQLSLLAFSLMHLCELQAGRTGYGMQRMVVIDPLGHLLGLSAGIATMITLGFFIFNSLGMQGAIIQMISHGFVSAAMFLCIGVLYDRVHSRDISAYGGVANVMPKFAALAVLFAMANCGLPGTAGFVGEWMVILATTGFNFWIAALAATALIFGAAYTLWMVKRVYFGDVANHHVAELKDVNAREFFMLAVLAVAVLAMGLYPKPFTDVMHVSVDELLKHVAQSKL